MDEFDLYKKVVTDMDKLSVQRKQQIGNVVNDYLEHLIPQMAKFMFVIFKHLYYPNNEDRYLYKYLDLPDGIDLAGVIEKDGLVDKKSSFADFIKDGYTGQSMDTGVAHCTRYYIQYDEVLNEYLYDIAEFAMKRVILSYLELYTDFWKIDGPSEMMLKENVIEEACCMIRDYTSFYDIAEIQGILLKSGFANWTIDDVLSFANKHYKQYQTISANEKYMPKQFYLMDF
jgi:hypothetical protein